MNNLQNIAKVLNGTLVYPNLHDGALVALEYLDDKRICLRVRDLDKRVYSIFLNQVEQFFGDQFMSGSIIFDITIRSGTEVAEELIAEAFGGKVYTVSASNLARSKERILLNEEVLFMLNPSYGCSIACICGGVDIVE